MNPDTEITETVKTNQNGLTDAEVAERLRHFGPNQIAQSKKNSIMDFFVRFKNPLTLVLIGAAAISAFFGDVTSSIIIIAIVLISGILDFINTHRSQRAAELLRDKVKITTAIRRNGVVGEYPIIAVVPDDIIVLSPGDIIPADGNVLSAHDFFVNESSLTGESFPVEKNINEAAYMGSSVISGTAEFKVVATAGNTKFGAIATALAQKELPTEFDRHIKDFSYLIMRVMFTLVIFVFVVNVFFHHNIFDSILFAAALAVGLTPELLPMIITLNLTHGSLRMAKHGVIVKKLSAIQNCGSMDILCTDKTGTLTEDKISLVKHVDAQGTDSEDTLLYAYLSGAYHTGIKSPLNTATLDFCTMDISSYKKIDEVPFDFERRRDSVVVEKDGKRTMITKGTPEDVFDVCKPMATTHSADAGIEYQRLSGDGFRVLAISTKPIEDKREVYSKSDEKDMDFVGFVAFFDPAKKSAADAIKMLEEYNVEIKIITGDNELVTQKVAKEIGLEVKGVLMGHQIEAISDEALRVQALEHNIFARVTPDQKTRIIRALQASGKCVGYMGDGINDAPSLKAADVGISVNNAVDVAKESAVFILFNKSLDDLINGVIEGRKTLSNTLKYLMMTLSSNFGNMFSMAGASLFIPFFPMLPVQILLNNLIYDGSQFAIPLDEVDPDEIKTPKKFDVAFLKKFMLVFGPLSSVFDFVTFAVLLLVFKLSGSGFQTGWFLESIATQTFVVYIIRTRKIPFLQSSPSIALLISTAIAVIVSWIVALSPLGIAFQFVPLPFSILIAVVAIVIVYLIMVEIVKQIFYKTLAKQ